MSFLILDSREASGYADGVQYWKLEPLMLSELQKQHAEIAILRSENADLQARLAAVESLLERPDPTAGAARIRR